MPDNHTQQRVYHYRSSAITNSEIEKPNANNLDFGEIAINYNAQEPSLFIKQNDSEIAQFVDKKYIEDNINSLSGLNDVNISSPMEEQSLVYDSVNNEYINKYALAGAIPYGRCDSSSTETNFTATVPGITELKDGTCMLLKNGVVNSTTGFTINVNGLGEKPVYNNLAAATSETTLFKSDYTILFIYDETRVSGGCWIYYRGYYASIGYQLRTNASTRKVTKKTGRYRILFSSPNNEFWVPATTSTGTTSGDVKTVNTEPINPFGRITYYGYTTVINSGSTIGTSYQWDQYNFYIGYSFNNVGTGLTLTYPKPVFVKCTPQQDGSAIIDSNTPYVQELPDTNDGKIYIYLGQAYSTRQIEMTEYHPVFYHDGNGIMLWTGKNIPNSLSELTNDTGYITSAATNLSNYASSGDVVTALGTKTDAAFKTIKVAGTSIIADSKDDTLTITAGANIGLVPNATNDSFVISATDTTYSDATTSTHGLMSIADKKKLNGIASGAQVNVQADWSETGTTSDAYIKNKPTIPTVNNNTITIQTNSNTVDTFTLNQSSDKTINIPIPTDVSDFTNDAGYITSADTTDFIASATVVAALDDKVDKEDGKGLSTNDYTTNEKNKLAGIQANAQKNGNAYKTVQVNASTSNLSAGNSGDTFIVSAGTNITLTAGNKKVTISAPSNISSFTNDAGYITSAVSALTYFATSSNTVSALNNKVDKVSGKGLSTNDFSNAYKGKLDNIASGAEVNVQSDWNVSDSNSDAYIKNKPTIGNAALTIQKNGTNVGSFSANQTTNKTINIAVPTTASDVNALPDSTKYAASLSLDINSSTYVVTAQLKDQEGNNLGTQQTIDLPLETMVVSGSYISSAKTVSLVLQNGNKIEFSVADLVSGLQTEITDSNKLSADLIENGNTNKVFTSSEKTKLSNLASSLATTSASGYMSSTQVTKLNGIESGAEVNVQSDWNETNSGSDAYILNKPNIQQIYTVEFEVRHDSTSSLLEDSIVSSNTSYSEILSLMNDGFEIKAHANFINDNEQIVYSIDMNRISSVGDFLVVFNGYILMVPYGSSEVLIAWDNNNSKWIAGESTPKLDVFYNDDQTPTVFSISLLNTDSIRIINEFQYLNDTNITNATSGDILTYHTNEYGGDGYWTNITPNFITSAVTAMTNYATSGDVVNSLNIVNNELPMSVYLFVNSSSGTAESYRDINGSEPISVREIVEYLNSGRTIEFYSKPLGWAGGQTPHTRLDNVMFGIGYNIPSSDRTYRIYGEAFNYANNKQYNFEAIDSTQDANPNYTWSATTTTSKSDYATKTYVDNAVSNIDDTIYIDGSGNTFTVYKSDDELYNLIVSDVRPNAVLMYNTDDSNTPIPMLCYFYNRQITNSGDSVYLRLHFVSSIEYGDIDLLFKRYTAMVVINMQKTYVDNVFHGYAINVYGSASFGHISISVPIPDATQAGQLLSVSSAGTYELISIVNSENIPY